MSSVVCWISQRRVETKQTEQTFKWSQIYQHKKDHGASIIFYFSPLFLKGSRLDGDWNVRFVFLFGFIYGGWLFIHRLPCPASRGPSQIITVSGRFPSAGPSALSSIPQSWFMNTLVPAFSLSPSSGALAVLYFTPHALLIRVDCCRDKISPVTKQGLWNHSADWVCSAWWEDEL